MTTTHSRTTLERWAQRLDLELAPADQQTRMDAASRHEPIPRWQLQSATTGHRDDVRGFQSLADVGEALEHRGIGMGREDAAPASARSTSREWSPSADDGQRLAERLGYGADDQGQPPPRLRHGTGMSI